MIRFKVLVPRSTEEAKVRVYKREIVRIKERREKAKRKKTPNDPQKVLPKLAEKK
jgi:hypothetical protein